MNLDFKMKRNFFDRAAVIDHFGARGQRSLRALSRAGAFVRTRMRSLLRRRKKIAAAGQAPSVHTQDATITLKNVQFAYDFASAGVAVGSVLTNGGRKGTVPVPRLMELGGVTTRHGHAYRYGEHPYAGPALRQEAAAGTLAECWSANLHT